MGRPAGSPNKDRKALLDRAEELGVNPFDILCEYAKDITDDDRRFHAAKELCQYIYPKRSSMKLSNDEQSGFKIVILDYLSEVKK